MKKIWMSVAILGVAVSAATLQAQNFVRVGAEAPQVKDDLFAGTEKFEQGATNVTSVNLDKSMLGLLHKSGDAGVASKMDYVVVHSYEYDKPGMYKMSDLDAYRQRLKDGSWNCFVHTVEKEESTDVCMKKADNETSEFVVMTAEPKELTFVHIRGRLSMNDLHSMHGFVPGMGNDSSSDGNSSSSPKLKKKDKSSGSGNSNN